MSTMADHLHMKWNDYETYIQCCIQEMRVKEQLLDVTLVCDNDQIKCHQLILSASSEFFKNIFTLNPHPHPLVYLRNIKFIELKKILDFMYKGEVIILQEDLESFLNTAEDLKVKGLICPNPSVLLAPDAVVKTAAKQNCQNTELEVHTNDDGVKIVDERYSPTHFLVRGSSPTPPTKNLPLSPPNFVCELCSQVCSTRKLLERHKLLHSDQKVPCDICGKLFCRKDVMKTHQKKYHGLMTL